MRLRTQLSVAFALVALVGVGAALLTAERYLAHAARETLTAELTQAGQVYSTFVTERAARREAEARVVAEEPRLKAAVRTVDIDQATLEDVAGELRRASGADLFLLTDRGGAVVADPAASGLGPLTSRPGFVSVAAAGGGVTTWEAKGALYQVPVLPLRFGSDVVGYLVTGYLLSDEVLAAARAQTGCDAALLVNGRVAASAMGPGVLQGATDALVKAPLGVSEATLGHERYVLYKMQHPLQAPPDAQLVLARSLDAALVAHAAVRRTLFLIGLVTLFGSLGLALLLSRRLTHRIEGFADAAARVGAGDLSVRVATDGEDEISQLGAQFNHMAAELADSRQALVQKERMQRELQIAQQIQTALLPRSLEAPGYQIQAAMIPAEEVGGDLYDVIAAPDGHLWLCIGDVTSHGLTPGLIMLMVQSAVSALVSRDPGARPKDVLRHLNRVVYHNVQERVRNDNYLTLTILRSDGPGRFIYSGAHLDLLVRRANGTVERHQTPGLWVGLIPELHDDLEESAVQLEVGDALILHTDGLTEARDDKGNQLELSGVMPVIASTPGAANLRDALLAKAQAHMRKQDDDITVLVAERVA